MNQTGRQVLQQMSYGLYVLGAPAGNGACVAILANWVGQVSFSPPLVTVSVEQGSVMNSAMKRHARFSVNLLPADGTEIARGFLKTPTSASGEFNGWKYVVTQSGCPVLRDGLSWLECDVRQEVECGDHTLFIAEVVDAGSKGEGPSLAMRDTGLSYWKEQK